MTGATMWSQADAVLLCRAVEEVCPPFGCHVALTGGTLYKDGPRKDVDLVFYRIRQVERIDILGLMCALERVGIVPTTTHGWMRKGLHEGRKVDLFFPELAGDEEYVRADPLDRLIVGSPFL